MYNELPHTGAGVLLLTAVATIMAAGGWLLRKRSTTRSPASASASRCGPRNY